jgi:prevent-host-death family protein
MLRYHSRLELGILNFMKRVTLRELRHHAGDVVDQVAAGERMIITRRGTPVAELWPLQARALSAQELVRRWRWLSRLDLDRRD